MTQPVSLRWRKSSRSASESNCVELAGSLDRMRDSKCPEVELIVGRTALGAFLRRVGRGSFDR